MVDKIEVRFTDVDSDGHVGHLPVIEWISHTRVKFIDDKIEKANLKGKIDFVLVNLKINFLKEIFYPDLLTVKIESLKIGTKSITTKCFVEKQGEPLVEAEYVNVFIDSKTRESIEIPNELKDMLLCLI